MRLTRYHLLVSAALSKARWQSVLLRFFTLLKLFEAHTFGTIGMNTFVSAKQQCSLHGRSHGSTDEAVKPMVVGLLRTGFPFVDGSAPTFGFDVILGGDLFGEHAVLFGAITTDEEAVQQKSQR